MEEIRILLVDDDEGILEVIGERIKSWGYQLLKCSSGKEAIDIIKRGDVDVVILDYMMPELDGVSTLKQIRERSQDIPVIMFTAYPDKKSIRGCERLGVIAYVPKMSVSVDSMTCLRTAIKLAAKAVRK